MNTIEEQYDAQSVEGSASTPLKIVDRDGRRSLVGYAVVWGAISSPRSDGKRHVYERGSIRWKSDVLALWHHQLAAPLARQSNGTLRIIEDDIGARVEIDLDDTTDGENARKRVANRLVTGMSFGVSRNPADIARTPDPDVIRITSAIGDEVSLTVIPSMSETQVVTADDVKNLRDSLKEQRIRNQKNTLNQMRLALTRPR